MRQEDHSNTEIPVVVQVVSEFLNLRLEQLVGDLGDHSGAVACFGVCVHGSPMGEGAQGLESILQDLVGAFAAHMGDEADAAGVMLLGGGIQGAKALCGVE
jgi:hypothetical protein